MSGPLNRFVQALSLLLVLAAFMGTTAASMPEVTETFAEELEQLESMDEVLPDFALSSGSVGKFCLPGFRRNELLRRIRCRKS
jgi:hypothetical protein